MTTTHHSTTPIDKPALDTQQPGIGSILREGRESTSQSIAQIAARLRIKAEYIQALEDDRPNDLPGRVYAIGFLRTYAAFLDLDPVDLIRRYKSTADTNQRPAELNFPKLATKRRQSAEMPAIAISALVVAAILFGWYYLGGAGNPLAVNISLQEGPSGSTIAAGALLPAVVQNPAIVEDPAVVEDPPIVEDIVASPTGIQANTETASPKFQAAEPTSATNTSVPARTQSTQIASAQGQADAEQAAGNSVTPAANIASGVGGIPGRVDTIADVADQSPTTPGPRQIAALPKPPIPPQPFDHVLRSSSDNSFQTSNSASPRTYGQINHDGRILLTARMAIWVQIRDSNGANVFTQMLSEGESYRVPNRPGLRLMTGNAGALDVFVDGQQAPSLGDFGLVLRDLELNADRLARTTADLDSVDQ